MTHLFDCSKVSGERILSVHRDFENDNLFVTITNKRKPFARRGILSVITMLFDPLGFTAPVILKLNCYYKICVEMDLVGMKKLTKVKCVLGKVG